MHGSFRTPGPDWVDLDSTEEGEDPSTLKHVKRLSTGIVELDRVLGGGLVPDSFTLIGR